MLGVETRNHGISLQMLAGIGCSIGPSQVRFPVGSRMRGAVSQSKSHKTDMHLKTGATEPEWKLELLQKQN